MPRRRLVIDLMQACALWLALGFSLGWYYAFMYYGRTGVPVPTPETCIGLVTFYFSVLEQSTWVQAIHWLAVFPLAGFLWVSTLAITAPFFGGRRVDFSWTLLRFAGTNVPLLLPIPLMMYLAGRSEYEGFAIRRMVSVSLRQGFISPPPWLTPLYLLLGVVVWVWQFSRCRAAFDLHGAAAWKHYLVSAIFAMLIASGLSTLGAFGLRAIFG